jgi:hypothetical protein
MEWASDNQTDFKEYFYDWKRENAQMDSTLHRHKTISEILMLYNSDPFLDRIQKARMRTLEVGAGENYIGIEPVASIYKRNMRIFANLIDIAEPGDRILVVYGAGHTYFFHRFIEQHADMKLVDVQNYLATGISSR